MSLKRLCESLGSTPGDPISLNQRVQGSSPCAPTIDIPEIKAEFGTVVFSRRTALRFADPMRTRWELKVLRPLLRADAASSNARSAWVESRLRCAGIL